MAAIALNNIFFVFVARTKAFTGTFSRVWMTPVRRKLTTVEIKGFSGHARVSPYVFQDGVLCRAAVLMSAVFPDTSRLKH